MINSMTHAKRLLQIAFLIAGALVVIATTETPDTTVRTSETWLIANRFDGKTGVSVNQVDVLTVDCADFEVGGGAAGARTRRAIGNDLPLSRRPSLGRGELSI